MSFYDLPRVRKEAKRPVALIGMTKATAYRKFCEKCALKRELRRQIRKCERDMTKYWLTANKE